MTTTSSPHNPQTSPDYPNGSYGYPNASEFEDRPINWKKYLFFFISNWYWFLITLGIALGIAFFKIRYTIPHYKASATIIIENEKAPGDMLSEIRAINYFRRQTDMANEIAKLTSFPLIIRTVGNLDQQISWTAHGRIRERPLYKNPQFNLHLLNDSVDWYEDQKWFITNFDENKFQFYQEAGLDTILMFNQEVTIRGWKFSISNNSGVYGHNTYNFFIHNPLTLAEYYKNKLRVETDEMNGTIITIHSEGPVGEREVDFLNTLCQTFILSELERKQQTAENTFIFIDEQIDVILDSLSQAEEQLLTFRVSKNLINLSREGEMAYEQLKGFIERKTQLRLKANYYSYLEKYVEERNDPQTIISPTLTDGNDALLVGAVQKLQELYEERENLNFSAAANNPSVESINARIQSTRLRIIEIIDGLMDNNVLTLEQLTTEEEAVIEQLKTLPINEQQLLNIKRKYDLYNQFYTFLLQKRAEAGIQKA
jgi:tyrosine-protein kinase Etk/Wzc